MAGDFSLSLPNKKKNSDSCHNGFMTGRRPGDRVARSEVLADNFLKAFEKPTQIYCYMNIGRSSTFLMHRTLSYMKPRMSRTHHRRSGFRVDEMLDRFLSEIEAQAMRERRDLSLMFKSFDDPHFVSGGEPGLATLSASVISFETNPLPSRQSSRCRSADQEQVLQRELMTMEREVPVNTDLNVRMTMSKDMLPKMTKNFIKCALVITVKPKYMSGGRAGGAAVSPDSKRRKKTDVSMSSSANGHLFRSEIIIYNSKMECCLSSGRYEVASKMEPVTGKPIWAGNSMESSAVTAASQLTMQTHVRMEVVWSHPPKLLTNPHSSNGHISGSLPIRRSSNGVTGNDITLFYQFVSQTECQDTKTCHDFLCPWCNLNCLALKSLASHLKNMHPRFTFRVRSDVKGGRIEVHVDVSLNELFDGSYSGNPQHLAIPFKLSEGPQRRTPATLHVFYKKTDFQSAFMDGDDDDTDSLRPIIHGHDRLYYHTNTCAPIRPQDMDIDSEDENDPQWMRYKTQQMLDEFTDVNDGEKEVMKLWNLHIMKYGFTGDCQIPEACRIFLEEKGDILREKNLRLNFILHLISLYDYGLIDAIEKSNLIRKLNQIFSRSYSIVSNGHSVLSQNNGLKDDKSCLLA